MRICFLNPFGTDAYDQIIADALTPSLRDTTELVIRHLTAGPRNLDYYAPKQLVQTEILKAALVAEAEGFDAFVIGCCYDPALTEVRELVKIPVIGPLEVSASLSRMFGHRFAVVTDHHKAVPEIADRIRLYGLEPNCVGVEAVGWFVDDMVKDPAAVARDTVVKIREVMARTGAETVVIGCTIVSACYELAFLGGDTSLGELSVINPNLMAVKAAELFGDLAAMGQYRISRQAYYQNLEDHDSTEAAEVGKLLRPDLAQTRVEEGISA